MHKPTSHRPPVEVSALKPEVLRLALGVPFDAARPPESPPHVETLLKFVRVGVWQARLRALAGQTEDLGLILTHLDEDVEQLANALQASRRRRAEQCQPREEATLS